MRKLLIIGGVPVDDLSMESALDCLEQFIAVGRATGKTHQIATINADFVVNALHDPELRHILQTVDMATADGTPVVLGARLLGVPLAGRVTGVDMVPALAERAAKRGYSVYLLGAKPGVAAQAGAVLQERYPGLTIVGVDSPPNVPLTEMDTSVLDAIHTAQPDILLVAFGNPKQEKWIHMHAHELYVPICIGVGGTFDMIAGITRRAPLWMQRMGLEWTYRLLQEPGRLWKRYVRDMLHFGRFFIRQWWVMRKESSVDVPLTEPAPVEPQLPVDPMNDLTRQATVIRVRGRLDVSNQAEFVMEAERALAAHPFLIVNLAEAAFLDSSALGSLVALTNRARALGGALGLAAVPPAIAHILSLMHLSQFFETFHDVPDALAQYHTTPEDAANISADAGEWTVIKAPRTLDAKSVPFLLDRCSWVSMHHAKLVLDCSETTFISGAGLTALTKLSHQLRAQGGELRVAGCSRDIAHSMTLVRLDRFISLYESVAEAIQADEAVLSLS